MSRLKEILREAYEILKKTPPIVRESCDTILFVGDLHGDYESAESAFKLYEELSPDIIVFLGDYVDRGPKQLETINLLLRNFVEVPERVCLLRGNHETPSMNLYYGFRSLLSADEYFSYLRIFSILPYIFISDQKLIALHGGIPVKKEKDRYAPYSLQEILSIRKGVEDPTDPMTFQILWNDPHEEIESAYPNPRGPGIYYYGFKIFEEFMSDANISFLVRAHFPYEPGYRFFFENRLLSIFSCRYYYGIEPCAAYYDSGWSIYSLEDLQVYD
ncbi:hypothetical protein B6U74_03150 [Candidatus Bathyarchaeota archaeon ex4484_205]|nr:MAG: hypothetical protein B6U74_03150 [Candidatus Bathyarchaeota archaeon ex4484_205]RLG68293.1 MAG: hypothetical protein DRN93_03060 [archaeon]